MALLFYSRLVANYCKFRPEKVCICKWPVDSVSCKGFQVVSEQFDLWNMVYDQYDLFIRPLTVGVPSFCKPESEVEVKDDNNKKHDPSIDRTTVVPAETSIRYLRSEAYKETYGNEPVWIQYRRNHKGAFPPLKTRKTCIRGGIISTGNPCPICRDEYLVLHHENVDLLNQFISPHTGEVFSYSKTGLCQRRHLELLVAIEKAKDYGFITFDVPLREYDYSLYYKL